MYIKRNKLAYLKKTIAKEPAIILIGTRQVGKTTLMKKLEQDLKNEEQNTFFFNLELPSALNIFSSGVESFVEYLKIHENKKNANNAFIYIFIDEFQYIPKAGKFFKALIDNYPQFKIVASGSSSIEIQQSLQESLVGRKRIIKIFPLDFHEFLNFRNLKEADYYEDIDIQKPIPKNICEIFNNEFSEFVIWGGMPKTILENDFEERKYLLEEICSSYLQKDIKGLLGAENLGNFNKLMILLSQESSTILSTHSLSNDLNIKRSNLENHLFILENTFVNFQIAPFFKNKRKELSKSKKTIFYDTGIRNNLIKDFSSLESRIDKGILIETAVFNEIIKNMHPAMEIYYWRTQHQTEIDIIIKHNNALIPIEIKFGDKDNIPPSLLSFAGEYKSPFVIVINKSTWKELNIKGTRVFFVPAFLSSYIPSFISDITTSLV
ncbi:MAG: ATP-binding protein [Elusimicrobiota bacterium]